MLRVEAFPSLLCLIVPGHMVGVVCGDTFLRLLFASTVTVVKETGPAFSSTQTAEA